MITTQVGEIKTRPKLKAKKEKNRPLDRASFFFFFVFANARKKDFNKKPRKVETPSAESKISTLSIF
jgi:hypothetical protein